MAAHTHYVELIELFVCLLLLEMILSKDSEQTRRNREENFLLSESQKSAESFQGRSWQALLGGHDWFLLYLHNIWRSLTLNVLTHQPPSVLPLQHFHPDLLEPSERYEGRVSRLLVVRTRPVFWKSDTHPFSLIWLHFSLWESDVES